MNFTLIHGVIFILHFSFQSEAAIFHFSESAFMNSKYRGIA